MKWFKYIALIFVILFIPAWPDGSPVATGITEMEMVDTLNTIQIFKGVTASVVEHTDWGASKLRAFMEINNTNQWIASNLYADQDSIFMDSLEYVFYPTGIAVGETLKCYVAINIAEVGGFDPIYYIPLPTTADSFMIDVNDDGAPYIVTQVVNVGYRGHSKYVPVFVVYGEVGSCTLYLLKMIRYYSIYIQ